MRGALWLLGAVALNKYPENNNNNNNNNNNDNNIIITVHEISVYLLKWIL